MWWSRGRVGDWREEKPAERENRTVFGKHTDVMTEATKSFYADDKHILISEINPLKLQKSGSEKYSVHKV